MMMTVNKLWGINSVILMLKTKTEPMPIYGAHSLIYHSRDAATPMVTRVYLVPIKIN